MNTRNMVRIGLVVLWAALLVGYVFTHSRGLFLASVAVIVVQVVVQSSWRR